MLSRVKIETERDVWPVIGMLHMFQEEDPFQMTTKHTHVKEE